MGQYLNLCQRIVDEGICLNNKRTNKRCLTIVNAELTYDVKKKFKVTMDSEHHLPVYSIER